MYFMIIPGIMMFIWIFILFLAQNRMGGELEDIRQKLDLLRGQK
jgi:hypothetical protein